MIHNYVILGVSMASLGILIAWMFMTSRVHYLIRMTVAAMVVIIALYNWHLLTIIMGYSVNDEPEDKSIILSFFPMKEKKLEYYWIYTPDGPKSFALPYSEKMQKKLEKAKQEAQERGGYMVYRRGKGDGEGDGDGQDQHGQNSNGRGGNRGQRGDHTNFPDDDSIPSNVEVIIPLPPKE